MGIYTRTRQPGIFKYEGKNGLVYGIDYYADGKRHRELVGPVFEDARAELQKMRDIIRRGKYSRVINQRTKTFNDLLEEYSKQMQDTSFYRRMIRYFKPVLLKQFGEKLLSEIDYKALEDFRESRKNASIKTKYQTRPRSKRTVDIEMAVLRRMFRKAMKWGWIMDDPFQNAEDLFYGKTGKRERALTPDEVRRLIDASIPHFKPILLVGILTGLRKADILTLRWQNINLERARITLAEQKTGRTRVINMGKDLHALFMGLPVKSEWVFPGHNGKPFRDVRKALDTAIRKAGIDPGKENMKIVFHTLRHSAISQLIECGADTTMVQNYVAHASPEMTNNYTHLSEEYRRKTGELLDGLYDVAKVLPKIHDGQKSSQKTGEPEKQIFLSS